jgi:hypothetical protein
MASSSNDQENSTSFEGLKCWYTNACSLKEKLDELRLVIAKSAPDIIFITETWFKPKEWENGTKQEEINLKGYACFRKDRESI